MDHLLHCVLVVLAQIYNACLVFAEVVGTCAIEETASRADNCLMNCPFLVIALYGKVRVLSPNVKSALGISHTHRRDEHLVAGERTPRGSS